MREVILSAARTVDPNIIDATGHPRRGRVRAHGVDPEHYDRKPVGMELKQLEMEAPAEGLRLAWTPRWLLSPTAMKAILAKPDKRTTSVKITVMNTEYKDTFLKNDIWFSGKRQRADGFIEISLDTLCAVCCS